MEIEETPESMSARYYDLPSHDVEKVMAIAKSRHTFAE